MFKFSVVVPVYNCEKYLKECIESVFAQTYSDFELILVDDGSTDRSAEQCDHYASQHSERVISVHNSNHGPYVSRINGIEIATGDIVMFLDSDDCLRNDALEILDFYFSKYDCDLIIYNAQPTDRFPSTQNVPHLQHEAVFEGELKKKLLYRKMIESRVLNSVCLKAVKKQYAQVPDWALTDCNLKHGEDLLLSACIVTSAPKILYIDEGIYHYRVNQGSTTHSYSTKLGDSLKTVHEMMDKFIVDVWNMPELIQLHDTRKVSGWMDTLMFLLDNKGQMEKGEFRQRLQNMAADPYFLHAYTAMDAKKLTSTYRLLAKWLYQKRYLLLNAVAFAKKIKHKVA